jgi:hypothetical protein
MTAITTAPIVPSMPPSSAPPTTLETYRDEIRRRCPPWLQRGTAERYMYALGLLVDTFGDALVAGVKHRFPNLYSPEALGLIGRERRISRGRTELDGTYAGRLCRWLTDHQLRGGPYALLAQLHAHFSPNTFPIELVYYSGRRFSMAADGTVVRDDIVWSPDTDTARWARWWLFYNTDAFPEFLDVVDREDLRLVPRQWNAAHTLGWIVLLRGGVELWNWPLGHVWNEPGTWNTRAPTYIEVDPL